jgi:CDP-ribitol ribitolphosphotransferase
VLGIAIVRAGFLAGRARSPRPYVVLATRDAGHLAGNLLSIQEELARRRPDTPARVIGYRMRGGLAGRLATAREAWVMGYHLAASRLFVADDWCFPLFAAWPRQGTTRVQVWHAAGAFKRFGFSVLDAVPGGEDADLLPMTANWDLCLASSDAAADHLTEAFRLPRERFTSALGLPRTDALYDPGRRVAAAAAIRRRYALPAGRRAILYAPTFRGETIRDARHPEGLDLAAMRDALAPGWLVLLRQHPLARSSATLPAGLADFVVDVSDWPDMNELMLVADLLVTDYSSAVFEFALLHRPMAVFAPDLAAYERERGLYLDVRRDLPGPVFESTAGLADWIRAGRFDTGAVAAFAGTWWDMADGHAAERFVARVAEPALRGKRPAIEPSPRPEDRVVLPVPPD